jgi:hypothetical protein
MQHRLVDVSVNYELPRIIRVGATQLILTNSCALVEEFMHNGMIIFRKAYVIPSDRILFIENFHWVREEQYLGFSIYLRADINETPFGRNPHTVEFAFDEKPWALPDGPTVLNASSGDNDLLMNVRKALVDLGASHYFDGDPDRRAARHDPLAQITNMLMNELGRKKHE